MAVIVPVIFGLFSLSSLASSQAPRRFGPGGIYPCRCKGSNTNSSNCDQNTGMCPASAGDGCVDGSEYGKSITGNCQIVNIALMKPATQTTTYRAADRAVDGKPYEKFLDESCTHTNNHGDCDRDPVAWWQVDLGGERSISAVWLLNRVELLHRLANIVVKVSNDSLNWQTCYSFTAAADLWTRRLCSRPLQGRYVRIEKTECSTDSKSTGTNGIKYPNPVLTLCEVMVVDRIYIAASVAQLTSTSIKVHTNESFYDVKFSYKVTLIDRGSHSCSTTHQTTRQPFFVQGNIITLNQLTALWDYTVHIHPVWNQSNYGPPTSFNFTTLGAAPSRPPSNLRVTDITNSTATVHWNNLTCVEWGGRNREYRIDIPGTSNYRNISLQQNTLSLTSLRPYTTYQVTIQSANEFGTSRWTQVNFTTDPGKPTKPRNVTVVSYNETSIKVRWTAPVAHNGPPGIYTVKVIRNGLSITENTTNTAIVIQGLPSGENYEIKVYASTRGAGIGPPSAPVKQHTKPPIPANFSISWTSADQKITIHLPQAGQNQYPRRYLILVDAAASTNRTRRSLNTYCTNASSSAYISANITNIQQPITFILGDNSTSPAGIWNQPLSAGIYTIHVIAVNIFQSDKSYRCISQEVTVSASQVGSTGPGEKIVTGPGSNTGAIAGGTVSAVVVLAAVAVAVIIFIRRRKQPQGRKPRAPSLGVGLSPIPPVDPPKPPKGGNKLPVSKFKQYVRQAKERGDLKVKFDALSAKVDKSTAVGHAQKGNGKNRFQNIVPYDENRVVLRDTSLDYINASRIKGFAANQKFIATQAPKDATLGDFCHMIWQEGVKNIVMLNQVMENGRSSCTQYWSEAGEKPVNAGEYVIRTQYVTQKRWYIIRELVISKKNNERRVVQYHFTSWPDKGVPKLGLGLLQIRDQLKDRDRSTPLLVHCRAGVGRTGTFIALDILLSQTTFFDIDGCINLLRAQRMNMVQVEDQYEFLHELLLESLTSGCRPMSGEEVNHWMKTDSYHKDLTQLLDVLAVTTLNNSSSTDEKIDEDPTNAPKILFFGCPATYTLYLIGFHGTSSGCIQSSLLSQCIHTSPEVILLICSSQQIFLTTDGENSNSTTLFGNVRVNQSSASQLTRDLVSSRIRVDICAEDTPETVYQNSAESAASWKGTLLRLNTDTKNKTDISHSLLEALNELGPSCRVAVLHDDTAEELVRCLCLTASTVSTIIQHHEVDVYSAAKELILKHDISPSMTSFETAVHVASLYMDDNSE